MYCIKHIIVIQNIFAGWTTEPCIFSKSELCKGPSVLFMKWIGILPGLSVFLPEGMHLAHKSHNEHSNMQFSSSDEKWKCQGVFTFLLPCPFPSHRKPCSF